MLINARKNLPIKQTKNPKHSLIVNVYENLEDYNPTKKRKVLIAFVDIIAGMESNKIFSLIVPEQ